MTDQQRAEHGAEMLKMAKAEAWRQGFDAGVKAADTVCVDEQRRAKELVDRSSYFPDCMMPDGAQPCAGYVEQYGENQDMRRRLSRIAAIIEFVENRCVATDGPVLPTLREMTEDELRQIWRLASGKETTS